MLCIISREKLVELFLNFGYVYYMLELTTFAGEGLATREIMGLTTNWIKKYYLRSHCNVNSSKWAVAVTNYYVCPVQLFYVFVNE